jgi:predicted dehydrogenase
VAIASRDLERAESAARKLGIPKAHGSYEELFADAEVEAVYNPLPNHLHVPVSIQAIEAGKHVLCEKPLAMTAGEVAPLIAARDRAGVIVAEAFMLRHHPQWIRARALIGEGAIGELRAVQGTFSYFNADADNIRNRTETGGGALYDIGVYPIVAARYLFGAEPRRVLGLIERDSTFGTDRLTTAVLDFEAGQASFVCSTQMAPYQRIQVLGTRGRIEIEIPFNAPPDRPCRLFVDDGAALDGSSARTETFDPCDQYRLQGEAFARCVRDGQAVEFPLEDSVNNMNVVDALFESAAGSRWVDIRTG